MINTPRIHNTLLIGDDVRLLAQLSCALATRNRYLGILDGPRMGRPDYEAEILRRSNTAVRCKPNAIILAGLDSRAKHAFDEHLPERITFRVNSLEEFEATVLSSRSKSLPILEWGNTRIGIGLLLALRKKYEIHFNNIESPKINIPSALGDLVVCEDDNEHAQIIAANYAFSIGAGLELIPKLPDDLADTIRERFYGAQESRSGSPTEILEELRTELRDRSANIDIDGLRTITFITNEIPWGFAYPQLPTTHLFSYPDLGLCMLNSMVAEQPETPGIRVALLVEPNEVSAGEIDTAITSLKDRSVFVSGMSGRGATVYRVSRMVELFPYDFLLISTHCGDAPGWRWTYKFVDSEGHHRTLVTEIAIGVAELPHEANLLEVMQYQRFVSFDGIDWKDKARLNVGTAMRDWHERRERKELDPVKKEAIPRVVGSAVLKMADQHYLPMVQSIADNGTPIVVNNACASWHELAHRFTFAGARAYIGTLTSVLDAEAEVVVSKLLGKYFGKPLMYALWRIQTEVYGDSVRRPYLMVGLGSQRLRTTRVNALAYILRSMEASYRHWNERQSQPPGRGRSTKNFAERARFLRQEIDRMRRDWGQRSKRKK